MNSLLISKSVYSAASKILFPSTFTPSNLSNPVCLQCVRWRRKPRWLPTAKTKMFRVTKRVRLPPEEGVEFHRLTNNYRTALKAIRFHLSEKIKSQTTAPEVIAEQLRLQEEDHLKCIKLNEDWNKEVAKIREKRVAEAAEKLKLLTLEEIEKLKEIEEEEVQRIEMMVRAEKEKSKSFITPQNIDEAIEKALNDTVDFNYCIDLEGNVYKGLRARPGVSKPDSKIINDGGNDNDSTVKQAAKQ